MGQKFGEIASILVSQKSLTQTHLISSTTHFTFAANHHIVGKFNKLFYERPILIIPRSYTALRWSELEFVNPSRARLHQSVEGKYQISRLTPSKPLHSFTSNHFTTNQTWCNTSLHHGATDQSY